MKFFNIKSLKQKQTPSIAQWQMGADFIDYILLNLDSGQNIESSFFQGAQHLPEGKLLSSIVTLQNFRRIGFSFSETIEQFLTQPQDDLALKDILENIQLSLKLGTPLSPILTHLSFHFRLLATSRLEELGNEAPVKMIFPLVLFIFPVILILLSAGAIENLLKSFYG